MSRRLTAVVLALTLAAPLRAQELEDRPAAALRDLAVQLDGQLADLAAAQARADRETQPQRTARVVHSGDVTLVLWSAFPDSLGRALAERTDSLLRRSGAVPDTFVRRVVFVMRGTADTAAALAPPEFAARRRLEMSIQVPASQVDDWWTLGPLLQAYAGTLDTAWAAWSQNAWGFLRWPDKTAEVGGRELLEPGWAVADRCLAGEVRACRLFLGLDAEAHPYRSRFTPAERRAMLEHYWGGFHGIVQCRSGDDDACVRVLETNPYTGTAGVPASGDTRAGLFAAVVALHGPIALRAALADRQGSVGERLARASGVSVDSLVSEWRAWALSGGRPGRVRAGPGDLLVAAITVVALVTLATRSRPWT